MNLKDSDYPLVDGAAWFTVKKFSIRIDGTPEGVIAHIFPLGREMGESIASAFAYDGECEEEDNSETDNSETDNSDCDPFGEDKHMLTNMNVGGIDERWPLIEDAMTDWRGNQAFGTPNAPLSQEDVDKLVDIINSQSSPEVIHMDGECSEAEADERWRAVNALALELKSYCKLSGLRMNFLYEIDL